MAPDPNFLTATALRTIAELLDTLHAHWEGQSNAADADRVDIEGLALMDVNGDTVGNVIFTDDGYALRVDA